MSEAGRIATTKCKRIRVLLRVVTCSIPTVGVVVVESRVVTHSIFVIIVTCCTSDKFTVVCGSKVNALHREVRFLTRGVHVEHRQHDFGRVGFGCTALALHDGVDLGSEGLLDAGTRAHSQGDGHDVGHRGNDYRSIGHLSCFVTKFIIIERITLIIGLLLVVALLQYYG